MSERGVAESTQWAMLIPALLLSILGMIQAGIWLHGRTVLAQAVSAAAEQAAWSRGSSGEAERVGERIAAAGGVVEVSIEVTRTSTEVRVKGSGRALTFFDLGQGQLSEVAAMPLERVTPP